MMSRWLFVVILIVLIAGNASAQSFQAQQGIQAFQEGNYDTAIKFLETDIRANPYYKNSHIFLATAYLYQEFPVLAELTSENALKIFENEAGFKWLKAEALLQQKNIEDALDIYRYLYRNYDYLSFTELIHINDERLKNRLIEAKLAQSAVFYSNRNREEAIEILSRVISIDPENEAAIKNRIFIYTELEDWETVVELSNNALTILDNNADIIRLKATAYYHLDELESLLSEYKKLYEMDPYDIDVAITYSEILFANQKGSQSEEVLARLVERYPENRRIFDEFVKLQERRMYIDAKVTVLKAMREIFEEDDDIYEDLTQTLESQESWEKAREYYREWLEFSSNPLSIHLSIADTYIREEKPALAEVYLIGIKEEYPNEYYINKLLGKVLQDQDKWRESIDIFEELPQHELVSRSGVYLAKAYFELNKLDTSKKIVSGLLQQNVNEPEAYYLISKIYKAKKDANSLDYLEKAIDLSYDIITGKQQEVEQRIEQDGLSNITARDADEVTYYQAIAENAMVFLTNNYPSKDILNTLNLLKERHARVATIRYEIAKIYTDERQLEKAESIAVELLKNHPKHFDSHYLLGIIYEEMEQYKKASLSFERALSIDPKSDKAYRGIVRIYQKKDAMNDLADRLKRRYEVDSSDSLLREYLIEVLHKANRFEEAQLVLESI